MSGKSNEDRYSVSAFRLDDEGSTPSVFAIIADGVGGHKAGEIAAEIAVNSISHVVAESDGAEPQKTLEYAIIQAGDAIQKQSLKNTSQQGMGSTCACAWIIDHRLYTASVGDSRIYLVRDEDVQQISIDHTWVQEALDHGIIKPEQARNHPRSHIIRRYLGSKTAVVPDLRLKLSSDETDEQSIANQGMKLYPGDQLLLCSDGLSDLVEENEIREALQTPETSEALTSLVELANERGGHDNITIIALKVPTPDETPKVKMPAQAKSWQPAFSWLTCAIMGAVVLLVIALVALGIWLFTRSEAGPNPTSSPEIIPTETTLTWTPADLTPSETPMPSETPAPPTLTPWPTNPPDNQEGALPSPTVDGL
jgi:protein phosphatase